MKAYFGDKSLLIFQAFSCFLEDFALFFLPLQHNSKTI